jgi:alcohol dehydrogenase (NADP+)
MVTAAAYGVSGPDAGFEKIAVDRRELRPDDVLIDIKYAGICHSDIHTARNEWRSTSYPCVPGHEIVGIAAAVGSAVRKFRVGDRVGVGCMVDSCGVCDQCLRGEEQFCRKGPTFTYNSRYDGGITYGGYSTHIVVAERFVVRMPEALPPAEATPLLCAGITLYSPLRHWHAGPGKQVAIIGMGGLGHLGVKLAHALGAEVTVLSQGLSKRDDGLAFGADHYYATAEPATFERLRGRFDLIVNTVSANLDLDRYLGLLNVDGTLVELGLPENPMQLGAFALAGQRRSLSGSMIGGVRETQEMLDFCAARGITATIELITAEQIAAAYQRVLAGDVRYRFVIDAGTF